MLGKFLRGLTGTGGATKTRTLYHWRCECGAHSRGCDSIKFDAECKAQRHQLRKSIGHPMPSVYSTEVEVPEDRP